MRKLILLITVAVLTLTLLAGCGGGGAGDSVSGNGAMTFRVTFPPLPEISPAYIPGPLMSLGIDILDAGTLLPKVPRQIVNRPSRAGGVVTVDVPDVHIGPTLIKVLGYDGDDCKGAVICQAETTCTVTLNTTTSVPLTLASTPYSLGITGSHHVTETLTTDLTGTAYDVESNIVAGTLVWESTDPAVASVDPDTGVVTGVAPGTCAIRLRETTQDLVKTWGMQVDPYVTSIGITPSLVVVNQGKTAGLTAVAYNGTTPVPDVDIKFTSLNPAVVSVVKTGLNTATITGEAESASPVTIRASLDYLPGMEADTNVTVTALGGIGIVID